VNGKIKNFKDLTIWQESIENVEEIYKITKGFPKEEFYGIVSQIRRFAVSMPSNIRRFYVYSKTRIRAIVEKN